jgi:hypothetical protein
LLHLLSAYRLISISRRATVNVSLLSSCSPDSAATIMASRHHPDDDVCVDNSQQQLQQQLRVRYTDHSVDAILFAPRTIGPHTLTEQRHPCEQFMSLTDPFVTLADSLKCGYGAMSDDGMQSICSPFITTKSPAMSFGQGNTFETPHAELELKTLWNQLSEVGGAEMVITKSGRLVVVIFKRFSPLEHDLITFNF